MLFNFSCVIYTHTRRYVLTKDWNNLYSIYSFETDIYSIGLLIHFIITETQIEKYEIDTKINYLDQKNRPKCTKEFEYLQNINI